MSSTFKSRLKVEFTLFKKYWYLIFLFCFIDFYLLTIPGRNLAFYLSKTTNTDIYVVDVAFKILPEYIIPKIHDIPQSILWITSGAFLILGPIIFKSPHQHNIFAVRSVLAVFLQSLFMFGSRAITMTVSILPDPSYNCRHNLLQRPQNLFGKI